MVGGTGADGEPRQVVGLVDGALVTLEGPAGHELRLARDGALRWSLDLRGRPDATLVSAELRPDEVVACVSVAGDLELRGTLHPLAPLGGVDGSAAVWLAAKDGRITAVQALRQDGLAPPCAGFAALRAGVAFRDEDGVRVRGRDGRDAARIAVAGELELIAGDGGDRVALVERDEEGLRTVRVHDLTRGRDLWSAPVPEALSVEALALAGDVLALAGTREDALVIGPGDVLAAPRDDDAGFALAVRLPGAP